MPGEPIPNPNPPVESPATGDDPLPAGQPANGESSNGRSTDGDLPIDDVEVIERPGVIPTANSPQPDRSPPTSPLPAGYAGAPPATVGHWTFLGISIAVIVLAFLMRVREPEQVLLPGTDIALPGVCTFKRLVGADCPGCGLTRCFISLAHGRPAAAWRFNPAGMLLFAFIAFQIPYRIAQLYRIRRGLPEWTPYRAAQLVLVVLALALFGQWIIRLLWPH